MKNIKNSRSFSRATHFRTIFKNSPPRLRRAYWLLATVVDLVGFFVFFFILSYFYSYLSLYLSTVWLSHLAFAFFFLVLGVLAFFFHTQFTLRLLSFFYKCYDAKRRKN